MTHNQQPLYRSLY